MMDRDRILRIQQALERSVLEALVCALPAHVLMTSGYWPVVGTSISIFTGDNRTVVLAPADEEELARVGFERGPASEPASYVAMHLFGGTMHDLLHTAAPGALLAPADDLLATLAERKTPAEVAHIRVACQIVERAFVRGASWLAADINETEAATYFRAPLSVVGTNFPGADVARADGFAFCMSGPNSALASGAYARSRGRKLQPSDLVLVHCNSYADGWWTDVTRTYSLGDPAERAYRIYEAVLHARAAALKTIRPGVRAREVDRMAREEIAARGFGDAFKHSTGHGVGFAAIATNARPRIHPKSDDVLEPGMIFNVEPAIYLEGFGGVRHCDMVAVTDAGVELLTPVHASLDDLIIRGSRVERPHAA